MDIKELKKLKSEILSLESLTLNDDNVTKNLNNLIAKKKEYGKALNDYLKEI